MLHPQKKPAIIQTQKKDIHEAAIGFIEEYKRYIEKESSRNIDFDLQKSLALAQAKFRGFDIDEKSALEHYERFLKKISDIKNRDPELYETFLAIGKTTDIRIVKYKDGGYNAIVKSKQSL